MQQAVESRFQKLCILEFIFGKIFGSRYWLFESSFRFLPCAKKKVALLPPIHMLQLDDKYFYSFWRTSQCWCMCTLYVCMCVCEGGGERERAQVCSESTFFFPKWHYRDFVKLDLICNLENHLVCDLQV